MSVSMGAVRRRLVVYVGVAALTASGAEEAPGQDTGKQLFESVCVACHTTGTDRLVGPGLAGVEERRDHDWLIRKITEPDRLRAEDDSLSLALLDEYGSPMPNLGITPDQAEEILAYLEDAGAEGSSAPSGPAGEPSFTEAQVELGRALFQGVIRLDGRGSSCNACHHVPGEGVVGGGSLAVSLGDAYTRLGYGGIKAIVQNPPFPVMKRAYAGHPVNDEEAEALLAFLRDASAETTNGRGSSYGLLLAGVGAVGSVVVAGLFTLAWRGRRRGPVKQEMFARQIESR